MSTFRFTKALPLALFSFTTFSSGTILADDPVLKIDATPGPSVSPTLYGLMTEEINHSYDGGLYAELIQNRSFKDDDKNPVHWSVTPIASATMALTSKEKINDALPVCVEVQGQKASTSDPVSLSNDGFWGIPIKPDTTYRVSFYAKSQGPFAGPLSVSIQNEAGKSVAEAKIDGITQAWKSYQTVLHTSADAPASTSGRFVISWQTPGTLDFNLVSLFPPTYNNRPNGLRPDLMEKMAAMSPKFLRLPGGNFLEGDHIDSRFDWKKTIGPIDFRPGHPGCWKYRASDGLGLLEFLEWCEDLHMQTVLAVYAGYSLKQEHVEPGPALQPYVEDALDEIEYVTGDASTKWGARRVADGHPEPFPVNYIEIGNEDNFDKSKSYDGRFAQFFDAIRAKYPKLKVIATTKVTKRVPDLVDDHYYRSAADMESNTHQYDSADRSGPKTFVGEWATREGKPTPNFNAALGDSCWMTMMEHNSDQILISSYAPLFANVGTNPNAWQWDTDLIGYNNLTSFGSPSYYAQAMFASNVGDKILNSTIDGEPNISVTIPPPKPKKDQITPLPAKTRIVPQLSFDATLDTAKNVIDLKVVNIGPTALPTSLVLAHVKGLGAAADTITLSAKSPTDTNDIDHPTNIVPVNGTAPINATGADKNTFTYTFPAYSITVLKIPVIE